MRLLLLVVGLLAALSAGQLLAPITTAYMDHDWKDPFDKNDEGRLWLALAMQPCASSACARNACPNRYCGRQPDGSCTGNLSATFQVQLVIPIACCPASGGNCDRGYVGGSLTVSSIPNITLTGPNGDCRVAPDPNTQRWLDLGSIKRSSNFCAQNEYWLPLFGSNKLTSTPAVASISVVEGNNPDVALYPSLTLAATSSGTTPPAVASVSAYTLGPLAGLVPSSVDCEPTPKSARPPAPSPCTGTCGCLSVTVWSRTLLPEIAGPGTLGARYVIQACALCKALNFEYLSFAAPPLASGVIVRDLGQRADGVYTTGLCSYVATNGTCSGIAPWSSGFCWSAVADKKCAKKFTWGACDTFAVTMLGVSDELVLQFTGKAGEDGATQIATIDSCPAGIAPPAPLAAPWACAPSTKAWGAACDQCLFPAVPNAEAAAYCAPIDGGAYRWLLVPRGERVPDGAFPAGTVDPATGFNTTCACTRITKSCASDCAAPRTNSCLCDNAAGQCRVNGICMAAAVACNNSRACPSGPRGVCNGNGACVCGDCKCTTNNGVKWAGAACDEADDCSRFGDCLSCSLAGLSGLGCSWCRLGTGGACLANTTCDNIGGEEWACNDQLVLSTGSCPNDCTCSDGSQHGDCVLADGIGTCSCKAGYGGVDCCTRWHGSDARAVGGIVAGVIAAIVVAGVVVFVATGAGVKVALHFARIRRLLAAARDNPVFGDDAAGPSPQPSASALPELAAPPPPDPCPAVVAPDEASGLPEAVGDSEAA